MNISVNLIKLKQATIVATLLTVATCLASESAQAGIARGNGSNTELSPFSFDLDDSTGIGNGRFPGAIQNFNYEPGFGFSNSDVCGSEVCPPGNLTVSKLTTSSDDNIAGLYTTSSDDITRLDLNLQRLNEILADAGFTVDLSPDALRYDVTFGSSSVPQMIWFIDSNDPSLIYDISSLNQFDQIVGIFPRSDGKVDVYGRTFDFQLTSSQQVPEPSATAGLLVIGALGALLLKHNKRLKKPV